MLSLRKSWREYWSQGKFIEYGEGVHRDIEGGGGG